MKLTKSIFFLFLIFQLLNCSSEDDSTIIQEMPPAAEIYFPPLDVNAQWETKTIADLNWNESQLQPLLNFLEEKNTKGFIILHEGKIVVENYMNGHSSASPWYWASAGKTLTTAVSGIAQDENILDLNDKVSDYIGEGWTSAPLEKENLITCKDLLSMTSGLNDGLGDDISTENLQYLADAGTRWAYHNVYVKQQDVIAAASNQPFTDYFESKLKTPIGLTGAWIPTNAFNVYWSNTRSMARFGLLISAKGKWQDTQIISEAFLNEATNTSQSLNESYGYLWWLNGKASYRLPQSQVQFTNELIPNAPDDMFAALGKNDQKIYIVPSKSLVIIRMGESADSENFALSNFDNDLWSYLNALID